MIATILTDQTFKEQMLEKALDYGISLVILIVVVVMAYRFFSAQLSKKDNIIAHKDEQLQKLNYDVVDLNRENLNTLNELTNIIRSNVESHRDIQKALKNHERKNPDPTRKNGHLTQLN